MSSVDVIVPCYRYGRFLRECVESVLSQDIANLRILIIDDASPDDTSDIAADLLKKDSRIAYVRHEYNNGHISTYNEGIDWTSATYTLLLSADDYLLPGALGRAVEVMDTHNEIGFTFGKAVDLIDGDVRIDNLVNRAVAALVDNSKWTILTGQEFFSLIESMRSINIVRTPTVVVRTELQKRVGGYRHELPHAGDLEMWLRLAAHAPVGVLGAHQAASRFHGNNMQFAYYRAKQLPDLKQRKAAIDCFIEECRGALANTYELGRRLSRPLAYEALRCANGAFGDDDLELVRQLSAFAVATYPEIRRTIPWFVLACKQWVSPNLWRGLRPAVAPVRSLIKRIPHYAAALGKTVRSD
jgi:hypothetical protein